MTSDRDETGARSYAPFGIAAVLAATGIVAGMTPGLECENWREETFRADVCGRVVGGGIVPLRDIAVLAGPGIPFFLLLLLGGIGVTARTLVAVAGASIAIHATMIAFFALL